MGEQNKYMYTKITTVTHKYHIDEIKIDNFK